MKNKHYKSIQVVLGRVVGPSKKSHDPSLIDQIIDTFYDVMDPELNISIRDLGLIYEVHLAGYGYVSVYMTLTTPNCPGVDAIISQLEQHITQLKGVTGLDVHLVFDPPYDAKTRMSDFAKAELDFMHEQ